MDIDREQYEDILQIGFNAMIKCIERDVDKDLPAEHEVIALVVHSKSGTASLMTNSDDGDPFERLRELINMADCDNAIAVPRTVIN